MSVSNDKKILMLRAKIQEKRDALDKIKFSPITSCSIALEDCEYRYNLHTLGKDTLEFLLVRLNSYRMSMDDLGIKKLCISGFNICDWISDIKMKLAIVAQKFEESELKSFEDKLNCLLSEDKKTELELSSIEKMLM